MFVVHEGYEGQQSWRGCVWFPYDRARLANAELRWQRVSPDRDFSGSISRNGQKKKAMDGRLFNSGGVYVVRIEQRRNC